MTPDEIFEPGCITFIQTKHRLWTAQYQDPKYASWAKGSLAGFSGTTHTIMMMDPDVYQDIFGEPKPPGMGAESSGTDPTTFSVALDQQDERNRTRANSNSSTMPHRSGQDQTVPNFRTRETDGVIPDNSAAMWNLRERAEELALLGRVGNDGTDISFWNSTFEYKALYRSLLQPCLEGLINKQLVTPQSNVYVPSNNWSQSATVQQMLNQVAPTIKPSADQQAKMDLAKRLHLMRGAEKQAAMRQLGLGGSIPHKQLANPGQKWWAPHSESRFESRLNTILEALGDQMQEGVVAYIKDVVEEWLN